MGPYSRRLAVSAAAFVYSILCILFVSVSYAADCVDVDGDGWGWDGVASCLVENTVPASSQSDNSQAATASGTECVDNDGDGWGWDGVTSCVVENSVSVAGQNSVNTQAASANSSECVDTDGDGWGWDGVKSCAVENSVSATGQSGVNPQAASISMEECVDHDGDGWGWDGVKSCEVNGQTSVSTDQSVGVTGNGASSDNTSVTAVSASNITLNGALKISPSTCEVKTGQSSCDVVVEFNEQGAGPHCLFEKQNFGDPNPRLLTCGNSRRIHVPVAANQSKRLELRSGSVQYDASALNDSRSVVGIGGVSRGNYGLREARLPAAYVNNKSGSFAVSWDGRLQFDVVGVTSGKRVVVVRALRPERMANQSASSLLQQANFSTGYIYTSDGMNSAEIAQSNINVPGPLGSNKIGIDVPFNIAVYPNSSVGNNPFRSDSAGNSNTNGQYETYRFYVVMGTNRVGNVVGEYDLVQGIPSRGKKIFLTRHEASVVVRNARTANADVHDVVIHRTAQAMRDRSGGLIYGYEPSATLDGRMIIYSGNSEPAKRNGHGGEVNYIFNSDQHRINGWSSPNGIADMYSVHGPGNPSGETRINGRKFSEHFPLAFHPLRQYNGEQLRAGDVVKGAYPWVSLRGSEVFFMGRSAFHAASRVGAVMAGYRTGGQLWHMDGDINNARGNPTDSYDHFQSGSGANNQYGALVQAYESRLVPGTNRAMGRNTWNNLFFRPLGQYPTSWNALAEIDNSPFPANPFPESYGFWLTGNRYYEIPFPLYPMDLIAYYPMNEPLYQNQSLLRPWMNVEPGAANPETIRRSGTGYITDKTADLSANQHTADLRNGAAYPFEYYDVKALWANSRVLKDQSEGAVGNSIFLPRAAALHASIKSQVVKRISETQAVAAALWFNSNTNQGALPLVDITDLIKVSVENGSLVVAVDNDGAQQVFSTGVSVRPGFWHHVAVSWQLGALQIYFDGREVSRFSANAELTINANNAARLVIGPNGSGTSSLLLKMDEVYLYAAQLSAADVATLAFKKRVFNSVSNGFFNTSGMANDYRSLPVQTDLSFVASSQAIDVGEQLFNSTSLSRDKSISCASCHQPARSFTDGQQRSSGINNQSGDFNTPTLVNALLGESFYYHGGATSLEGQAIHTILENGEMGLEDATRIITELPDSIRGQLQQVYQRTPGISEVAGALAAYVKTIRVVGNTHRNDSNLTPSAQRGRRLFYGKANCVACHNGSNFTDNLFHDIGLNSNNTDRATATNRLDDRFRRKTPTLRNVALTAPYFNDGSAPDLAAVVRHYSDRSHRSAGRVTDPLLHPLELNDNEVNDLVEYLGALTGQTVSGR